MNLKEKHMQYYENIYKQLKSANSFNSLQKCPLNFFFLPFFLKQSNFILFFYAIAAFVLIRQFIQKIYDSISKNISSWFVNLVFEICLDSKFPVREEILKIISTIMPVE